jgi:hypothetical protein
MGDSGCERAAIVARGGGTMAQGPTARPADGERCDYLTLAGAGNSALEGILKAGVQPKSEAIVGYEFKGYNVPAFTRIAGIRKFKKGFYRDGSDGAVRGYNVKVRQNRLGDAWIARVKQGSSVKHGWFDVYPVKERERDNLYPNALLLNYAGRRNPRLDPSRLLRDYLVQVYPDNHDLFLGKAYVALGNLRFFLAFFLLERSNPATL